MHNLLNLNYTIASWILFSIYTIVQNIDATEKDNKQKENQNRWFMMYCIRWQYTYLPDPLSSR